MYKKIIFLLLSTIVSCGIIAQAGLLTGKVWIEGNTAPFAQVSIEELGLVSTTDEHGTYMIKDLPYGEYSVKASYIGYTDQVNTIAITKEEKEVQLHFKLKSADLLIDEVVITGTKTFKRKTESPVIVNVINSRTISNVQACNLSESLNFQPGLRVETDCQTCNYTQLRMNGLTGGYSQILINGRPIFSPLTGLYGMEQLPASMIDRIEVVRGGGSSLYGSSAIGGTVNVISKIPEENAYELDYNYHNIDGSTHDHNINGMATTVSKEKNAGISFFINHRDRGFYDANDDSFSEIPLIQNTSIGSSLFFLPAENQKLELNLSKLYEYRLGGEMLADIPAYLTQQSEERTHNVWMASADYQINFNEGKNSLITYAAWQHTDRKHYTGIQPDRGTQAFQDFLAQPPYGTSDVSTYNVGLQLNHQIDKFITGSNVFTLGAEYIYDSVLDDIPAYKYIVDQQTTDLGAFLQSDWEVLPQLNLLTGIRLDDHNLVDKFTLSPRASLLYKVGSSTQFRVSYGTGFRAPQAFDTDLHIAFAGGGVSRVSLSPGLKPEKSRSLSGSINYDKIMENWIAGFTLEGFHNRLNEVFYLNPAGEDAFGEVFVKENGDGATVQGLTLELRANFNRKVQLEGGFTYQSSKYDEPVQYIDEVAGIRSFIRTPADYGYGILTITPDDSWNFIMNYKYTGTMKVPHFAGAPNQSVDEIITSPRFSELGLKVSKTIPATRYDMQYEIYGGVKNLFNAYQDDFDLGKNRDSNYIYGPGQPRTLYIGVKLRG